MTKNMQRLAVIATLFLLAWPEATQGQPTRPVDALFVHQDSHRGLADAMVWQDTLRDYQIECRLVSKSELGQEHLLDAHIIIVGTNTAERSEDKSVPWFNYWGDSQLVDVIVESELPIIGISMAALSLFGQMDMPIGGGYYAHGGEQFFTFAEDASKYLESPFKIDKTDTLKLSTRPQQMDGYYHPPVYVESILQNVTNPSYYSVVRYENYVVWGAGADAGYLTESGRRLFANITHQLAGLM